LRLRRKIKAVTDEERYIAQGRARDAAKKLKGEIATLRTFFDEYKEQLRDTGGCIDRFLEAPSSRAANDRLLIDYLNWLQRKLCEGGFFENTAEFMEKTRKLRELEEQIKDF
jgi:hypothetical protein